MFCIYLRGGKYTGVYEVTQNARLYEVIEAAGGLTEDAAEESVNQAREIVDGEMVRILTQEEAAKDGLEEAGNERRREWMAKQPKIQMAE